MAPSDSSYAQAPRLLQIASSLGDGVLVLRRLRVQEAMSRPFTIEAECISTNLDITADQLINTAITCTISRTDTAPRHFHGIVNRFSAGGVDARGVRTYRLTAVPRLWNLSRTVDCRIFQQKSVKEIVETLLGEGNVAPKQWGGSVATGTREYVVQYNESDLDFIQRLLAEIGAGYYFTHSASDHTLCFGGANADYPLIAMDTPVVRNDNVQVDSLTEWSPTTGAQPGKVVSKDFDQLNPSTLLAAETATALSAPGASAWEVFIWPGGQQARSDGDPSRLAMEGLEAAADIVAARGANPAPYAGGRMKVKLGIDATSETTWLLTAVTHEAFDETHFAAGGTSDYASRLNMIPADRVWRPGPPPRRPPMPGLSTAIVTGPSGDEIHTDEYGRIKVRFLWDRAAPDDDTSSCWVRVSQPFAGAWGGTWFLPRIGDEVLIGFLFGDQDHPVCIGSLYNNEGKPPWALPGNKTQSGMRTKTSTGGGETAFNMIMMDDKSGQEMFQVQAQKDMEILIRNDRTALLEQGNDKLTVKTGNMETLVKTGNWDLKVDTGNMATKVATGNQDTEVSTGNISHKASLGKIEIEAMQSITLTVGSSKITIDQMGVKIEGMMLKNEAQAMSETKAPITTVKGDGMLILKGGIVLIN